MAVTTPLPDEYEGDVVLADGGTMHVRPITPDDGPRILRFHERQSPESIYFRYFSPRPRLTSSDIERLTSLDGLDRMAFVGIINDEVVGVARYDRHPSRATAEVAFFTDDGHAGRGMATVLLEYLAAAARDVGITAFTAQVLPTNRRMLSVFRQVGFEVTSRFSDGVIEVEFPIEPTPDAMTAMAERARRSEARSVARILAPRSVAVIGASRRPDSLGQAVFRRLLAGGFDGPVYPVNPEADVVASVRAHPSILDVPDEVDLAIVVVPAEQVPEVVEQCGRKRVQGLVVISAGFAEAGPDGVERQEALVEQARRLGLRLVGPNTMGVVNTGVHLLGTFAEVSPIPGGLAVSSQSGTIGAAILRRLGQLGVGVSSFVATGNKADVSGNDLLQYWETDDATEVIVLYLESFGNPRNFARIARRVGRAKPIVAVKPGRAGEEVADALFAQTGIIRVDTLDQLFGVARTLLDQPLPTGRRVAVLSTYWGPAALAADACVAAGLDLAPPVELPNGAGPAEVQAAIRGLIDDPDVDALLVLHAPRLDDDLPAMARAVGEVATDSPKPVVASFLGAVAPGDGATGDVPVFEFPEAAAQALGRVAGYADWCRRQTGVIPALGGIDVDRASELVQGWLADPVPEGPDGTAMAVGRAADLLACVGLHPVEQRAVRDADAAVAAADEIGWPVALKASGVDRPSRTEEGGVAVDVHTADEMHRSYARMAALHGPAMDVALVQAMAHHGVDGRIEVAQHPELGPILTFGPSIGGTPSRRILPLTDDDAEELVERGPLAVDLATVGREGRSALVEVLLRLSALTEAVPEVTELRLGPVIVSDTEVALTDVHLVLTPGATDPPVRRLD